MRIVLARLQSLKVVARANEGPDSKSAAIIDQMTALGQTVDIQLPAVLHPADDPAAPEPAVVSAPVPDVASMTIAEAHDAVQAGVITRQDAVDAGVVATVDALPPHPSEIPAPTNAEVGPLPTPDPITSAPAAVADAPASSVPDAPNVGGAGGNTDPNATVSAPVAAAPVPDSQPATPIVPAPTDAPVVDPSPPQPVDRLTALEQRVTADEAREQQFESDVKSGKVSRQ